VFKVGTFGLWLRQVSFGTPCAGSLLVLRPRVSKGADHVDKAANTNLVKTTGSVSRADNTEAL